VLHPARRVFDWRHTKTQYPHTFPYPSCYQLNTSKRWGRGSATLVAWQSYYRLESTPRIIVCNRCIAASWWWDPDQKESRLAIGTGEEAYQCIPPPGNAWYKTWFSWHRQPTDLIRPSRW